MLCTRVSQTRMEVCPNGKSMPYSTLVGKRKPPVGTVAGWRWFDLWAIRCFVLQVLIADFLKLHLGDDADVVAIGAEGMSRTR